MKRALYPGSFDPITLGHIDVIERAAKIFDEVIVLVAINKDKKGHFTPLDRVNMIKEAISYLPNVKVDYTDGLTINYAKSHEATHLIRGLRAITDFDYEFQLASANEYIDSSIDTIFLMSKVEKTFISSSMIMGLYKQGVDISKLVPPSVINFLNKKDN